MVKTAITSATARTMHPVPRTPVTVLQAVSLAGVMISAIGSVEMVHMALTAWIGVVFVPVAKHVIG